MTYLALARHLSDSFTGNPLEVLWEGHLQFRVADWLLDAGWTLISPEPGGDNLTASAIARVDGVNALTATRVERRSSVDIIAIRGDETLALELKTYPSFGPKKGRSGMEQGLAKDLQTVRIGGAAFLFVADVSSYRSMRGERAGNRGPKMRWHLELPDIAGVDVYGQAPDPEAGQRILWRVETRDDQEDRIVCLMFAPDHADVWRIGPRA